MTAKIESLISSAPPVVVSGPAGPQPANDAAAASKTAAPKSEGPARAPENPENARRVALWKAITEAGGISPWIAAQLSAKGLATAGADGEKLSDAEKANYKARKKAEADERRVLRRMAWEAYRATHVVHLGVGVHWDDRGGNDKFDPEKREDRARVNDLPDVTTAQALADALGLSVSKLRWLTFHRDADTGSHYRRWSIPKRDGTARTITSPKRMLKTAQRWALRNVAEKLPVHSAAHGFLPGRSIVTNANAHAGADVLVKIDVKDFFPTLTFRRVKGLLRAGGLTESAATLLALLCTEAPREVVQFRGKTLYVAAGPRALPQGAPTSPAITNAVCMRLDRRLSGLARSLGFAYTRYADDLTFSWRKPTKSEKGTHPRAPTGALVRAVKTVLRAEGFEPHPSKTRVMRAGNRQTVTGLVINRAGESAPAARVPRETVRALRAAIHNREKGKPGREGESLAQLKGMAAFVHMTDPARGRAFLDRIAALEARERS